MPNIFDIINLQRNLREVYNIIQKQQAAPVNGTSASNHPPQTPPFLLPANLVHDVLHLSTKTPIDSLPGGFLFCSRTPSKVDKAAFPAHPVFPPLGSARQHGTSSSQVLSPSDSRVPRVSCDDTTGNATSTFENVKEFGEMRDTGRMQDARFLSLSLSTHVFLSHS